MEELDRSVALRTFFARYVAAEGRARDPRIEHAFAAVERASVLPAQGPGLSIFLDSATSGRQLTTRLLSTRIRSWL